MKFTVSYHKMFGGMDYEVAFETIEAENVLEAKKIAEKRIKETNWWLYSIKEKEA